MHRFPVVCSFLLLLLSALPGPAPEAACPPPGTVLFPGTSGIALQDSLRGAYRPPVGLTYATARDTMYAEVDNHDGYVTGIYTGFTVYVDPASSRPRTDAFDAGINAEHTWPQSKGAENLPAQADLHHLFPSEIDANGARAAFPFAEIPDPQTDRWYRLRVVTTVPDPALLDEYSELDLQNPDPLYDGRWEPREEKKGDVARAMFYFYTMYRAEADAADPAFFDAQRDDLRAWNAADPPDEAEYQRTCAVATHQAGRPNPFVIDPTLVDRAYFPPVPVRLLFLRVDPGPDGVRLEWETAAETDFAGFRVLRAGEGGETPLHAGLLAGGPAYAFLDRSGRAGERYAYRLEGVDRDGSRTRFGPREVVFPALRLRASVRPNPARAGERVRLEAVGAEPERIDLFDPRGRWIRSWSTAAFVEGWDGRLSSGAPAPAGVYFLRVSTRGGESVTLRVVRLP